MKKKEIKIGFIGAGSLGSMFGAYLASIQSDLYSVEVVLFCRKNHADAINKTGLTLEKNHETNQVKLIKAYESMEQFCERTKRQSNYSFDYLFLTVKTYDIKSAMLQYKKLVEACRWLIVLQNGIGNEEIVKELCPEKKIIRGVTIVGALLEKPGYIVQTGLGVTKLGFPFVESVKKDEKYASKAFIDLNEIKDLLNFSGIETITVNDIMKECWEKIFVNIGINALGALTRLKNGKLMNIEGLKRCMGEAVKEAVTIAIARSVSLTNRDFVSLTYEVAEKTAENKNSMLQDILKGKITEIEFMNGRIVKYAKEIGLNAPINELLTDLINGLEASYC